MAHGGAAHDATHGRDGQRGRWPLDRRSAGTFRADLKRARRTVEAFAATSVGSAEIKGGNVTQAQVDELEDKGPDEVGKKQVYLGGHGLRVQINKGPNTWFQQVITSSSDELTTMGLGRTRRISFVNAKKMGRILQVWAGEHTMQDCRDAARAFRERAATGVAGRRVSLQDLQDAWYQAISADSSHDKDRELLDRVAKEANQYRRHGGGEGKAHEELKEHVKRTPSVVGLPAAAANTAESEYMLPSQDEVDVMFCYGRKWVAVEVKSVTSEHYLGDIRRGLYQCVKYKALTEAMLKDLDEEPSVRSVLVLGFKLPRRLKDTQKKLGVEVIEDVSPD